MSRRVLAPSAYPGDMSSAEWARDAASVWDIATPSRASRLSGASMAGFRQQSTDVVDLPAVPYPAVTVGIDIGDTPLVIEDATGRQLRGSVVAGLAPEG